MAISQVVMNHVSRAEQKFDEGVAESAVDIGHSTQYILYCRTGGIAYCCISGLSTTGAIIACKGITTVATDALVGRGGGVFSTSYLLDVHTADESLDSFFAEFPFRGSRSRVRGRK